jgi:hypothetical protein
VSVLRGNGDGTFQPPAKYAVGWEAVSVAAGDFTGNGILDLVVADLGSSNPYLYSSVSVLLGNGDGTFQPAQEFAAGISPRSVAVGDFNGDGILDLAVAGASGTRVLLGNGDGSFQTTNVSYVTGNSNFVAVGDFNGDGFPDLAVAGNGVLNILDNDGNWNGSAPRRGTSGQLTVAPREPALAPAQMPEASGTDRRLSVDLPPKPVPNQPIAATLARTSAESNTAPAPRVLISPRPLRHALIIRASWDLKDGDLGPGEAW